MAFLIKDITYGTRRVPVILHLLRNIKRYYGNLVVMGTRGEVECVNRLWIQHWQRGELTSTVCACEEVTLRNEIQKVCALEREGGTKTGR